jgi:hypothetical protein
VAKKAVKWIHVCGKHSSYGKAIIVIDVDDQLTIGTEESIEEVINWMKEHNLGLINEDNLIDFLSCKIFQERDKKVLDYASTSH